MIHTRTTDPYRPTDTKRAAERIALNLPARLNWKDQRGIMRFAPVVTKNVSKYGVYIECQTPISLPLYRLVQFQLENNVRGTERLPPSFKQESILAAVYRVMPPDTGGRGQGFALRLMIDPGRQSTAVTPVSATA
jgi:hypothetical protein